MYHKGGWSRRLELALWWWKEVLEYKIRRARPWGICKKKQIHMFCDARGSPPHIAAVLLADGVVYHTSMRVTDSTLGIFMERQDNQIMGLETLSIALGRPHIDHFPIQLDHSLRYISIRSILE